MKHILLPFVLSLAVTANAAAPAAQPAAAPAAQPAAAPVAKPTVAPVAKPIPAAPAGPVTKAGAGGAPAAAAKGAVVETVVGTVQVEMRPGASPVQATVGMALLEGVAVVTGRNGRVFIRFGPTDLVRLKGDTRLVIVQAAGSKPGRVSTLLQLVTGTVRATLRRAGVAKQQNFGIVAGSTVCAVKGTMFDMTAPAAGALAGKVEIRCDDGGVGVGVVKADEDLVVLNVGAVATRVLKAGYMVTTSAVTGQIDMARRAPPRTTLEVVGGTGKVTGVVGGQAVAFQPGDEIPAGSRVSVSGGSAVLAGTREAVQAADGTSFSYDIRVESPKGAAPTVTSVVSVSAGSAVVDAGGNMVTAGAGQAAVVSPMGMAAQMSAAQAAAMLNPPAPGATPPAPAAAAKPAATAPAVAAPSATEQPGEVLPELPSIPEAQEATLPPPPATPEKDTETVPPAGSGENPVSPSMPPQ